MIVSSVLTILSLFLAYNSQSETKYSNIEEITGFITELKQRKDLFKIYDGFDRYFIERLRCQDTDCSFPIIEVTNFKNGKDYVSKLPTILLISGFDGQDEMGINVLLNFLQYLREKDTIIIDRQFLLNNFRFLVVPVANMVGYYNNNNREVDVNVDQFFIPLNDFPHGKDSPGSCLVSSTARIINQLFLENLIIGVLNFQKGEYAISYPFSTAANHYKQNADIFVTQIVAAELAEDLKRQSRNIPLSFKTGDLYELGERVRNNKERSFEDWAFSGSWDPLGFNPQCLGNTFDLQQLKTTMEYPDETNRAFTLLFQTGLDDIETDTYFQEKINIFNKIIQKAASFINPKIEPMGIGYNKETSVAKVNLRVNGCIELMNASTVYTRGGFKQEHATDINSLDSLIQTANLEVEVPGDESIGELIIGFNCKNHWNLPNKDSEPHTHVLRAREWPHYNVTHNDYRFYNKRNDTFTIFNFKKEILESEFVETENYDYYMELMYDDYLIAKFEHHILNITYTHLHTNTVNFEVIKRGDEEVPEIEVISLYEYGEKGCCEFLAAGKKIWEVKAMNVTVFDRNDYYSMIGRLLTIKLKGEEKVYPAVVQPIEEKEHGYMLSPGGLACSSHNFEDEIENFFYVEVQADEEQVRINVYSNRDNVGRVKLNKHESELVANNYYNSEKYGKVLAYKTHFLKFSNVNYDINNEYVTLGQANLASKLRGKILEFTTSKGDYLFHCTMGLKNPFYEELDNILYGFTNYSPNAKTKISKKVFFGITIAIFSLFFVMAIISFICYSRIKQQIGRAHV